MTRSRLALLLLAAAALAPSPARAQRDTIRLGAPRDTLVLTTADTAIAPARNPRWATPFAVETSGQAAPGRTPRDVVWLDADSVRARRRAARLAAAEDSASGDSAAAEPAEPAAAPDTAAAPPRRSRRAAADTAASTPRRTSRTAARDTASTATPRRSTSADSTARRTGATRARTHRVADGETLYGIARRYGVTTAQIRALNPELVPGELATGTVLRLPAGARAPAADSAARRRASAETEEAPARRRRTHTVAAHETLYGIARRYGVTVDALKAANRLTGDALRTGQTLVIPAAPPR
ncbi:MAG: LysM peptidoglycan-binding domain-containing protein [Longimicrobiaceae bacterium]